MTEYCRAWGPLGGEGGVLQSRFEVRIVFFHSVCGIVEDECLERVKLVWRSKTIASSRVLEDWDPFKLAAVTGAKESKIGEQEGAGRARAK